VVDEFAPEVYSPLSKKLKTRCVESNIHGDGTKCSKSLDGSYLQHALVMIDVSYFFTWGARHGALLSWR